MKNIKFVSLAALLVSGLVYAGVNQQKGSFVEYVVYPSSLPPTATAPVNVADKPVARSPIVIVTEEVKPIKGPPVPASKPILG